MVFRSYYSTTDSRQPSITAPTSEQAETAGDVPKPASAPKMAPASDLGTPRKRGNSGNGSPLNPAADGAAFQRAAFGKPPRRVSAPAAEGGFLTRKKRVIIAGALGTIMLVLVAAAASGAAMARKAAVLREATAPGTINAEYCDQLPLSAQVYCRGYYKSPGSRRFAAASQWQRMSSITYNCAGITTDCLNKDLKVKAFGSTCRPLTEGSICVSGAKCSRGICGGDNAWKAEQEATAKAITAAKQVQQDTAAKATSVKPPAASGKPTAAAAAAASAAVKLNPAWSNFTAWVDPNAKSTRVPETFLATSHEWDRITDYADNIEAFKNIFSQFGPSPILRMGGASQDFLVEPPRKEIWEAMAKMQKEFNARFLIGLPLWKPDSHVLARRMMELADEYLPKGSVLGFELGNEPEFWPTSVGGYKENDPTFLPGFENYAQYFGRVASDLNPCGTEPRLSGPGWGNVNTIDAAWLALQAKAPGARCYMRELSVHYYPYVNNDTIDARGLLDQNLQDFGLGKFNWLQGVAKAVNLKMRISETNSLYGGGRAGLSDTMAGTMWCADALFAFANAGAAGFHFHWGFGGRPIHGGQPNTGVQTNFFNITTRVPSGEVGGPFPSVHAPWYGYLLFRLATAGPRGGFSDTTMLWVNTNAGSCGANMKIWGLLADDGSIRTAILNKDTATPCNAVITFDAAYCGKPAALSRLLPGRAGMASKDGITWQGQSYASGVDGVIRGSKTVLQVKPSAVVDGKCTFAVPMDAASGAVLELPPSTVQH